MKHLVIGKGEVGTALQKILDCDAFDLGDENDEYYDVIHICFPYKELFEMSVLGYKREFDAKYVVIHSTVPVGTSASVEACHSPIRGVHPFLEEGIRTFTKYFGGKDADIMAEEFKKKGLDTVVIAKSETTELMKLVDTTTYGLNILIEKEIYRLCEEHGANFSMVYTNANQTYNDGYKKLGMPQYSKYILEHRDGKIGGHCINENAKLLKTWMNDLLTSN